MPRLRPEPLVLGLTLTGVGLLWILGNLGRIDFLATLHTWWPLSLLVWGVLELALSWSRGAQG